MSHDEYKKKLVFFFQITKLFYNIVVTLYIPISSVSEFKLLHILANPWCDQLF